MPVYEYLCRGCGDRRDELRPMADPDPGPCPVCGGERRRVYGRVGIRFEGWGFARTDALLPGDRPRRDFRTLREKASEIADG